MEHWENSTVSKRTVSFLYTSTILIKKNCVTIFLNTKTWKALRQTINADDDGHMWRKGLHLRFYSLRDCQGVSCLHVHQHLRRKFLFHWNQLNQLGICSMEDRTNCKFWASSRRHSKDMVVRSLFFKVEIMRDLCLDIPGTSTERDTFLRTWLLERPWKGKLPKVIIS